MSLNQGSLRFPTTRLLEADYKTVLANKVHHHQHVKRLESILSKNEDGIHGLLLPPASWLHGHAVEDGFQHDTIVKQLSFVRKRVSWQEQVIRGSLPLVQSLLLAAKMDPANTAHLIRAKAGQGPSLAAARHRSKLQCAGSVNMDCNQVTLPLSRFCLQHQCLDSSQVLYRSCCSISTGNSGTNSIQDHSSSQCGGTVLDIFSNPPLCSKHIGPDAPSRKKTLLQQHSMLLHGSKRGSREGVGKVAGGVGVGKTKLGMAKLGGVGKAGGLVKMVGGVGRKTAALPGTLLSNKVVSPGKIRSEKVVAESKSISSNSLTSKPNSCNTAPVAKETHRHWKSTPTIVAESSKPSATLDDLLTLGSSMTAPKLDLLPLKADIGDIMMAGEDSSNEGEL